MSTSGSPALLATATPPARAARAGVALAALIAPAWEQSPMPVPGTAHFAIAASDAGNAVPLEVATAYVTGAVTGTLRNDFSGWVGMRIVVGAAPLSVGQLGRIMAPGNTGSHLLKLVTASDGVDVIGGAVTVAMSGGTVGQFRYGTLPSPVMLTAGTAYLLVSQETAGGDQWYDYNSVVSTTTVATTTGAVWSTGAAPATRPLSLTWDDKSWDETGFIIERSVNGGAFIPIATVAANVVNHVDTTAVSGAEIRIG